MKYYVIPVLVLVGYLQLGHAQTIRPAEQLPVWTPPRNFIAKLGRPITIGGFRLRPPVGYSLQRSDSPSGLPSGSQVVAWAGPPRVDGTRPQVLMTIVPVPSSEATADNLDRVLSVFLAGIESRRSEWKQTPVERGIVTGNVFVRSRWDGVDLETGAKMHGVVYTGIVGNQVVELASQDVEPFHRAALALAEASILTFAPQ
jgi:hypothetical protein